MSRIKHDEPPSNFEDVFNVKKTSNFYNVYKILDREKDEKEILYKDVRLEITNFNDDSIGYCIRVEGSIIGYVYEMIDAQTAVLAKTENDCFEDDNGARKFPDNAKTIRIEAVEGRHKHFMNYVYSW
jgi:hypothetical protein